MSRQPKCLSVVHDDSYIEIPAPIGLVCEVLPRTAPQLPRVGGGTWQMQARHAPPDRWCWIGEQPELTGACFVFNARLIDAGVTTGARLHIAAALPRGGLPPWSTRQRVRKLLDAWAAAIAATASTAEPREGGRRDRGGDEPALDEPAAEGLSVLYPRTVAAFEAMGALSQLHSVAALDRRWAGIERGGSSPKLHHEARALPPSDQQWDLIYAGGGLGLLHALVMRQRYGYRVVLFDRGEVGQAHREWNLADEELRALVGPDLFAPEEIEHVVVHRHDRGVVRFHAGEIGVRAAELWMRGVLDVSLDAGELLRRTRQKFEQAGGQILDYQTFLGVEASREGVAVQIAGPDGQQQVLRGRLLLDGMGAISPLSLQRYGGHPFDGVCPTVGSIVSGLEPGVGSGLHDPTTGDILVSVADTQRGRQLIWEGFAGRDDQLTVYLFYYDRIHRAGARHALIELFEDYFTLLATYKRPGAGFRHHKPVYGFIPARHTERRVTARLLRGVLPIGDAAAQQSPLTFTGFGSHVRNLDRTTALLDYALRHDLLAPRWLAEIGAYQANVALHWVFSRFMQPWGRPNDVNRLQNVFARVLRELDDDVAERFFKDRMRWRDYGRIVNHTLAVYRPIIPTALAVLGPRDTLRWIADYLRFSRAALAAAAGRQISDAQWYALERLAELAQPGWRLVLSARRREWRVMGWLGDDASNA